MPYDTPITVAGLLRIAEHGNYFASNRGGGGGFPYYLLRTTVVK